MSERVLLNKIASPIVEELSIRIILDSIDVVPIFPVEDEENGERRKKETYNLGKEKDEKRGE